MEGRALQDCAATVADELPRTSSGHPFTPRLHAWTVAGRIFLLLTEDPAEPIITVKADPAVGEALVDGHDAVQRGRYMSKRHWISVGPSGSVTPAFVENLVRDSYDLVVEGLPRGEREALRALDGQRREG